MMRLVDKSYSQNLRKIDTAIDISKKLTNCDDWSVILPKAIKDSKNSDISRYLDGYYEIIELDRQLEEKEKDIKMSKKYRNFLSFSHLSENMKSSEVSERLFNKEKARFYLTAALESQASEKDVEGESGRFSIVSLNQNMTKSYISKLMVDKEETVKTQNSPKNFLKKKNGSVEVEDVDDVCENFNELDRIDFDKALFSDVGEFDYSTYKLPKEGFLREETMKRILKKKEIEIEERINKISNKKEELISLKIIENKDDKFDFERSKILDENMDKENKEINSLFKRIEENGKKIDDVDLGDLYKVDYEEGESLCKEIGGFGNGVSDFVGQLEELEKSICRLTR